MGVLKAYLARSYLIVKCSDVLEFALMKMVIILASMSLASAAAAQTCQPVRFTAGESGAFLDGILPPKDPFETTEPPCFSVDVRAGQQMAIEVVGGDDNVAVTVLDVGDARRSFSFRAPSSRVEFLVFQLLPSPLEASYSILVTAF